MGSSEFVEEIVKLYQTIWYTCTIPKSWGHSKLVTLWKGPTKGKVDDPTTYRGLQIGSSLCKIIIIIVINRLKSWYEKQLLDQQQGFRSSRGTTDGIFFAKSVQQITRKWKSQHLFYLLIYQRHFITLKGVGCSNQSEIDSPKILTQPY